MLLEVVLGGAEACWRGFLDGLPGRLLGSALVHLPEDVEPARPLHVSAVTAGAPRAFQLGLPVPDDTTCPRKRHLSCRWCGDQEGQVRSVSVMRTGAECVMIHVHMQLLGKFEHTLPDASQ